MSATLELLIALAVLAGSAPASAPVAPAYEIRRVATCRDLSAGKPVDPTDTLRASEGKVMIWFQGEEARSDVDVRTEWYVNGIHEVAASHTVRVTRGSDTGVFTLEMPGGAPLPVGSYRVDLVVDDRVAAQHVFRVVADHPPAAPPMPRHLCEADGFSIPIAPGFEVVEVKGRALALQRTGDSDTGIVVVRQREPGRVAVAGVLERARATMAARANPRLVSSRPGTIDSRTCLVAVIEDRDGSRQKAYAMPRESGSKSRDYYVIVGSSPGARFSELEEALDRMALGFRVEPMAEPARLTFPVLFTAGTAPRPGELAPASSRFAPTETTVHVRFRYEGATAGQELVSVWHRLRDGKAHEFARSAVKLERPADLGQFSFSPDDGRWPEGTYRVDIRLAGRTLRSLTFTVATSGADL